MNACRVHADSSCSALQGRGGWLDFESDPIAVHVLTEDGIIAGTNRAFDRLFGSERSEFVGLHHAALNNHSVAANLRLMREIRVAIDRDGVWRGTLTNRDVRGMEFTARAHVYPMRVDGVRRLVCFQEAQRRTAIPPKPHNWGPTLTAAAQA